MNRGHAESGGPLIVREPQDERLPSAGQDTGSLLALLQLTDSAFPCGTFVHSFGLEQLVRDGVIKTPMQVEEFVTSVLRQTLATADAPAGLAATIAMSDGDLLRVITIDRALHRMKAPAELRNAATTTGRRLLEETSAHLTSSVLDQYLEETRTDPSLGSYPVAFGVVCSVLGIRLQDVPVALMLGAVYAILQAAMRLLPFSHRDAQGILHRLRPEIATLAAIVYTDRPARLSGFHPLQEIASMRHALGQARLFSS